jgi:Tannase-like family of unknown function (DUF6351)
MKCNTRSICRVLLPVAMVASMHITSALAANQEIIVLSNRADLISGGDALVEVIVPPGIIQAMQNGNQKIKASLNSQPLPQDVFALRPNGRVIGLVTGLKVGENTLTVQTPGRAMSIVITNHPIGGPVFAGVQLEPWICATKVPQTVSVFGNAGSNPPVATATSQRSGLNDDPVDAQCNTPITYEYYYQPKALEGSACVFNIPGANDITDTTGAVACFVPFPTLNDPSTRPADAAIANFTNDRGDTAKSIIRVERGSINRGLYYIKALYDPAVASAPWSPQKGWNQKLLWELPGGAGFSRFESQATDDDQGTKAEHILLGRGYMSARSSLTSNGSNSNSTLGAETLMMIKEHIIENYGEIRYTMGTGCSGGSLMQTSLSSAYPGLLDGLTVNCTFEDMQSTWKEVADCDLVQGHYYATPNGAALSADKRTAINGDIQAFCTNWSGFFRVHNPSVAGNCGGGFPAALVYSAANPHGVRCSMPEHHAPILGKFIGVDGIARANTPRDNVGVQYGLRALQSGAITAEEFVQLNEGVGGYDVDGNVTPNRMTASSGVLHTMYSGGLISDGRQFAKMPIIDVRVNNNAGDIHANWRSMALRARLDQDHGSHDNNVIWATGRPTHAIGPLPASTDSWSKAMQSKVLLTMDEWLSNIESDPSSVPIEAKVVNNKPVEAVDFCLATYGETDAEIAAQLPLFDPACPVKFTGKSIRQAAGEPVTDNYFKCQLKPLVFADPDYTGVLFTPAQQARLQAVFPAGVCDFTKPPAEQVPVNPWTTFAAGPGGQPLGPPPVSVHLP